jgi:hypothetical protein
MKKIGAFESWCCRKILRISWMEKVNQSIITGAVENHNIVGE